MKKTIYSVFIVLSVFSFFSCDTYNDDKNCYEAPASCNTTGFTKGTLKIKYTLNEQNPTQTIYVYQGDYDADNPSTPLYTIGVDSNSENPYSRANTPVGKYSARISYIVDGAIVEAIDGGKIESEANLYCDGVTCYELQTPTLDCTFDEDAYNKFKSEANDKCFVATAFYGSPHHAKVNVLRNFRDRVLNSCRPGKAFVSWYYKNSPPAADFIRKNRTAHFFAGSILIPTVFIIEHPSALILFPLMIFALYAFIRWKDINDTQTANSRRNTL